MEKMNNNYVLDIEKKLTETFVKCKLEFNAMQQEVYVYTNSVEKDMIEKLSNFDFVNDYRMFNQSDKNIPYSICIYISLDNVEFIDKKSITEKINNYTPNYGLTFEEGEIKFTTDYNTTLKSLNNFNNELSKENIIIEEIELTPEGGSYNTGYIDYVIKYKIKE